MIKHIIKDYNIIYINADAEIKWYVKNTFLKFIELYWGLKKSESNL